MTHEVFSLLVGAIAAARRGTSEEASRLFYKAAMHPSVVEFLQQTAPHHVKPVDSPRNSPCEKHSFTSSAFGIQSTPALSPDAPRANGMLSSDVLPGTYDLRLDRNDGSPLSKHAARHSANTP